MKRWKAAPSKRSATTAKAKPVKAAKKSPAFKESFEDRKLRAKKIFEILDKVYPDAECALVHETPFQLLIATILSAQCTDARVNMVTPGLFKKYPQPKDFAAAPIEDIEREIRSTGFFKNKAKNIKSCSEQLLAKHGGEVPHSMEELVALPGVGRKTANVVLGNAFDIPGLVVDTHVGRLSYRMGLAISPGAKVKNAEVIEKELMEIVPKENWTMMAHWLISHGRAICIARSPKCNQCQVAKLCPRIGV